MKNILVSFLLLFPAFVFGQVGIYPQATASGTDTYSVSVSGLTSLIANQRFTIRFTNGNGGPATIDLDAGGALPAKTIVKGSNLPLEADDIRPNEIKLLIYDGVNLQIVGGGASGWKKSGTTTLDGSATIVIPADKDLIFSLSNGNPTRFIVQDVVGGGIDFTKRTSGVSDMFLGAYNAAGNVSSSLNLDPTNSRGFGTGAHLRYQNAAGNKMELRLDPVNGLLVTDNILTKGLYGSADFSAQYVSNSYVQKVYVDANAWLRNSDFSVVGYRTVTNNDGLLFQGTGAAATFQTNYTNGVNNSQIYVNPTTATLFSQNATNINSINATPNFVSMASGVNSYILTPTAATAGTFTGRHKFTPTATISGFNFGTFSGTPSNLQNGDAWYNLSVDAINAYINSQVNYVLVRNQSTTSQRIPVYGAGANGQVVDYDALKFDGTGLLIGGGTITANTPADIRGISGANVFRLANNTNNNLMLMTNAGALTFTSLSSFNVSSAASVVLTGTAVSMTSQGGGNNLGFGANGGGMSFGGGTTVNAGFGLQISKGFNPVSGTNTHKGVEIIPTWNTTGTYAGDVIDLDINSTNTSLTGANHLAVRATSGTILHGTSLFSANSKFEANFADATGNARGLTIRNTDATAGAIGAIDLISNGVTATIYTASTATASTATKGAALNIFSNGVNGITLVSGSASAPMTFATGGATGSNIRMTIANNGPITTTHSITVPINQGYLMAGGYSILLTGSDGIAYTLPSSYFTGHVFTGPALAPTSGTTNSMLASTPTFNPTSGTADYAGVRITPVWNTTSTYAGNVRDLFINSTNTSLTGAIHYAIESASGIVKHNQAVLGDVVTTLSTTSTNSDPTVYLKQNRVTTTDATQTTLHTETIPATTTVKCAASVVARRTGGAAGTAEDGAGYQIIGTYKNVAGTATLIGAVSALYTAESQAAWDATFTVTGATVLVRVTGALNNNVTWHLSKFECSGVTD